MTLGRCERTGKVMFTKKDAQTSANRLHRDGRSRVMRAYHCDHCNAWHVTSKPEYD